MRLIFINFLLKKEVCMSRKQYMRPTEKAKKTPVHVLKKKTKNKRNSQDLLERQKNVDARSQEKKERKRKCQNVDVGSISAVPKQVLS